MNDWRATVGLIFILLLGWTLVTTGLGVQWGWRSATRARSSERDSSDTERID